MLTGASRAGQRLARLAVLGDAAAVFLAAWPAWWLRFREWMLEDHYLIALVLGELLVLVLLPALGAYRGQRWVAPVAGVLRVLPGLTAAFLALVVLAAATKTSADFSRLWVGGWFLASLALMGIWRSGVSRWLAARGARERPRLLIIGVGNLARQTAAQLLSASGDENPIAGFMTLDGETPIEDLPAPVLGGVDRLEDLLTNTDPRITEIWLALGDIDARQRRRVMTELQTASLPVRYVPDLTLLSLIGQHPRRIAGMTVIELNATPLDGPDAVIKAALDRLLSALLLLLLSPLLLGVAILIRLDSPGPVLFRQPRHGGHGRIFDVLKFRTMRVTESEQPRQAKRGDPRVTRIGRWLRSTSLDELPQLINVVAGDMSLVGPRPHPVSLNYDYSRRIHAFMQRHRVKPGITGWAQVHGCRGETDTLEKMRERFEHDLYYIEHWSLGLDLQILLRTLRTFWRDENAY